VLTHRRTDTERAPVTDLAQEVERCLGQASIPAVVEAGFPVKTRRLPGALASRKIDIVIPSKLSSDLTINCMAEVIGRTLHRNFEMRVVVTQTGNLTDTQLRARERLCADERVRVEILNRPAFNYSLANNFGAAQLSGEFICLLNDDVQPMDGDWLDGMLSFFTDESVGIVGAKLYYPNMTVQHGGVIVGLAGLCEHANRYLPKGEPGYAWRGELDQEFSAVTGACLLVRRDIFNAVGGLNEAYATGFNDVDFCLRVRELGYAVVFAGSVEMIHHETVTFGHHYAGDPEREASDIQRMRARWGDVVSCDPFHNPNLSLVAGSEWMPSFPPRG
jgi:GT2 family glycosyltransferase